MIKFEKFFIYGWSLTIGKVKITSGVDSYGKYYRVVSPFYKTYIFDWDYKQSRHFKN